MDRIHRTRICNPPSQCSNMTVEHCTDSKSLLPHVSWPALACVLTSVIVNVMLDRALVALCLIPLATADVVS